MAIGLIVRGLAILGWGRSELPKALVTALSLLYVVFYIADVFVLRSGFMISTVRMLFFFTALRLVTAQTSRDYFYLGVLAFLHLMAASMFVGGISYLAVLLLFLIFSILTYTAFEIRRGCQSAAVIVEDANRDRGKLLWVRLATLSMALSGGILVLSFALFLVIPRTLGSSSVSPLRGNYAVGFSDEVNLGNIGSVQLDHTPVMRIKESSGAALEKLKWRGLALRHFSGTRWSNPSPQDKIVEPNKGQYLFARPLSPKRTRPPHPLPCHARTHGGLRAVSRGPARADQRPFPAAARDRYRFLSGTALALPAAAVSSPKLGPRRAAPAGRQCR